VGAVRLEQAKNGMVVLAEEVREIRVLFSQFAKKRFTKMDEAMREKAKIEKERRKGASDVAYLQRVEEWDLKGCGEKRGRKDRGGGEGREKMKAKIDQEQTGEKKVKGVEMQIVGRIKGANRASKKEIKYGKQNQQDRVSKIDQGAGGINTKYGTVGIRIKRALRIEEKRVQRIR